MKLLALCATGLSLMLSFTSCTNNKHLISDAAERNAVHAQHFDEAQVDLLGLQSGIDQHEQEVHPFTSEYVSVMILANSSRWVFDVRA